jgi:hypothetical protein
MSEPEPVRYVSFKPLDSDHVPIIKKWLNSPDISVNQNSVVSLNVFHEQEDLLLSGVVDIEGNKKPLKPFVIYDNDQAYGYTHFYQTTEEPNEGAALAIFFKEPLTEDKQKESAFIELFLENYVYPEYAFCIVDIDRSNQPFIELFESIGFSLHTEMDDFLIMVHHPIQEY